jgi:hypothetical protein
LYCPEPIQKATIYHKLERLREFWDTELPRFGDVNSLGWEHSLDQHLEIESSVEIQNDSLPESDDIQIWHQKEVSSVYSRLLPVRNSMDEDVQDPFETVLFDDIKSFLFELKSSAGKLMLVENFLEFLGAPGGPTLSSTSAISLDPFQHDQFIYQSNRTQFLSGESKLLIHCSLNYSPFTIDSLFGIDDCWPGRFEIQNLQMLRLTYSDSIEFIIRVLTQAKKMFSNVPKFSCILLWLEFLLDPKNAEKSAKRALKQEPMNLLLWNVYCQIVWRTKSALEVF